MENIFNIRAFFGGLIFAVFLCSCDIAGVPELTARDITVVISATAMSGESLPVSVKVKGRDKISYEVVDVMAVKVTWAGSFEDEVEVSSPLAMGSVLVRPRDAVGGRIQVKLDKRQ